MSEFKGKLAKGQNGQMEMHIPAKIKDVIDSKTYENKNGTEFIRGLVTYTNKAGEQKTASAILISAYQEKANFVEGDDCTLRVIPTPGQEQPLLVISGEAIDRPTNDDFFTAEQLASVKEAKPSVEA